ncbi:MAG: phenylalanine--tRNA ligase subunit beta [Candidatus Taylorbacteria bacterium]|nr:phenylalanine--tRNA ligase subunit beta [Candidatus Taylorbacteria bacterium]
MFVSRKWLQTYFNEKLPGGDALAELLNFHAFEVEDIKYWDTDEILDVKILADRACYALSHRGIASEIAAAANLALIKKEPKSVAEKSRKAPDIEIKKHDLCSRYIGRQVEKVEVGPSPEWLVERLESIGERSINNVVDAANFVMFDLGQPLHAFDADKVRGAINVRLAKKGEQITTLDNREVELDAETLIIADEEGPLAIAGIKGGKRAEVTLGTKNLILEAAHFDASSIRLTSTRLDIKTAASKRFESKLSATLAEDAMKVFSALIKELVDGSQFGPMNDVYKKPEKPVRLEIRTGTVSEVLGLKIAADEIIGTLRKVGVDAKENGTKLICDIPPLRSDLRIPEDIIEEVGRIYGYEKIKPELPEPIRGQAMVNKNLYYKEKIKDLLVEVGFSEVIMSTFSPKGKLEVAKPLAEDKKYLRSNLADGLAAALERNAQNAPLLGLTEVRIFELGSVFGPSGEKVHLGIARQSLVKKDRRNEDILNEIVGLLGTSLDMPISSKVTTGPAGAIAELDITELFVTARSPHTFSHLWVPTNKAF